MFWGVTWEQNLLGEGVSALEKPRLPIGQGGNKFFSQNLKKKKKQANHHYNRNLFLVG